MQPPNQRHGFGPQRPEGNRSGSSISISHPGPRGRPIQPQPVYCESLLHEFRRSACNHLPQPKSLHFFFVLFSSFSPFVHVLGTQGHTGRLKSVRLRVNQPTHSCLQSLGTHPRTASPHHQSVNHLYLVPGGGISSGKSSGRIPHRDLHQSKSQHCGGQSEAVGVDVGPVVVEDGSIVVEALCEDVETFCGVVEVVVLD